MKFKEIKPNMVIHCSREKDARALLEHLRDIGYKWFADLPMSIESAIKASFCPDGSTAYRTYRKSKDLFIGFNPIIYYTNKGYTITEFSDLVEPESRFKVGDRVKIKEDLMKNNRYGKLTMVEGMMIWRGKESAVIKVTEGENYDLVNNSYHWSEEMLEPVENSTPEEKPTDSPINSPTDSPINESDLISREELFNQFRLYLNRSDMGETTADSELRIGEIASVIKNCPSASAEKHKSEMSAVEVLEWLFHFVSYDDYSGVFERLHDEYGDEYGFTDLVNEYTSQEIVDKITAYEAAKKAPKPVKVEWVDMCRIIRIKDNGFKL